MGDDPKEPEKPQPARPEPARPTSEKPEPVRPAPARPTPARSRPPAPSRSSGEPGSAESEGPDAPAVPTPGVEPDVDARTVEIDGATWTVKVAGRAAGGASLAVRSTAPLLLLRFSRDGEAGTPPREVLVVGKTLERLTEGQLEQAFATSEPASEPGKPHEIFPGTSSRRGRGGG